MKPNIKGRVSLEVSCDGVVIFESDAHWLHPLLDLTDYLKTNHVNLERAEVRDRIVGRAAALLILRLGAAHVHGDLMSELAVDVLQHARMPHSYNQLVRRIDCATEEILQGIDDPEEAYLIVCKRARRG